MERCLPTWCLVVGGFAMLVDVEAFFLYARCHTQAEGEADTVEKNQSGKEGHGELRALRHCAGDDGRRGGGKHGLEHQESLGKDSRIGTNAPNTPNTLNYPTK